MMSYDHWAKFAIAAIDSNSIMHMEFPKLARIVHYAH